MTDEMTDDMSVFYYFDVKFFLRILMNQSMIVQSSRVTTNLPRGQIMLKNFHLAKPPLSIHLHLRLNIAENHQS